MNSRPFLLCLFFLTPWTLVRDAAAQRPADGRNGSGSAFANPAEADRAFGAAADLPARSRLVLPVAEAYLRAHRFGDLTAKLASAATTPADASWQRGFLLAQLHAHLGNAGEAARLLKELPEEATRDPEVLKFRLAHPELVGEPPEGATATLVQLPGTAGERVERVGVLLDAMKPELALEIIAAHPDDLCDEPDALARSSPQFADLGLVPRLIPLLAARVERQPADWRTRLFLAHFQLLAGNATAARDHLQRIQDQKEDAPDGDANASPSPPARVPTLPERVAALDGFTLWHLGQPQGGNALRRVIALRHAQDVALICFGGWAAERGEGARFLQDLKERHRGDDAGWLAALMLLDSQGLVLRELRSQLARGTPPDLLNALAYEWLNAHQFNRRGISHAQSGRGRLRAAYAKLAQSAKPIPSAPGQQPAPSVNPLNGPAVGLGLELWRSDPADRARVLARLEAFPDATMALREVARFLGRKSATPVDENVVRSMARLLVKVVAQGEERLTPQMVLHPAPPWTAAWPRPDRDPRGRMTLPPGGAPPTKPLSPDEEVASAFFAQSAVFPWQTANSRQLPFSAETMPATLPAALAQLSVDPGAPDHAAARTAEAYALSRVPGQADRAIAMLRGVTDASPSYVARFWLVALLAERGRHGEAAEVLAATEAVPGHFATLVQGGVTLLQRAGRGEPPLQRADFGTPPAAGRKVPNTTAGLLAELRRLISGPAANDPATAGPALALADQLSTFRPAETGFPERLEVFQVYQRFGKLVDQIPRLEERTRRFPASADAWLALGDALSLADPVRSVPAYEKAFALAPDRPDIAEKVSTARFPPEVRVDAYCVLLRKDAAKTLTTLPNLLATFQQANAWPRFVAAFGQGFNQWGRRQLGGSGRWDAILRGIRQTAGDEVSIGLLTAMCQAPGLESSDDAAPENALIALLTEKHRTEEIAAVVEEVLFPSETLHGLDVSEVPPLALLNPPGGLEFIAKVTTPGGRSRLKQRARQLMAEHPGEFRPPLVLLTLLILERDPNLSAELVPCLKTFREDQIEEQPEENLTALAQMAAAFPAGRSVGWDLLAEVRRRRAGTPAERATVELIARTALDLGDQERARVALRELVTLAKSQKTPLRGVRELTEELCLMARAGAGPEADELAALVFSPAATAGLDEVHAPVSSFPLIYLEACAESGRPEFGAKILPEFLRRLAGDAGDKSNQQRFQVDYPARIVEALVAMNLLDGARSALKILEGSWQTSASSELRQTVENAQRFLARATGETSAPPVAFLGAFDPGGELTCWWDLAAMNDVTSGSEANRVSVLGADLPSLAGRRSVQILGGETPNRLVPLATIPNAPSRGAWRGPLPKGLPPASLRFTRVILAGPGNETVIGPSLPVTPGVERLRDPDLDLVRRAGDNTAQWTLPEGTLRTMPGPIPGRPGLGFVQKGVQGQGEIRGERIPVRPGESFVQSAWLRAGEGCQWGRRYLDAAGREVGLTFIPNPYGTRGWTLVEQRLEPVAAGRPSGEQIPADAAFLEPVLRLQHNGVGWQPKAPVHLAGLSLRSVASVADGPVPTDPATTAPDHLGPTENAPVPTPAADKFRTRFASISGPGGVVAVSPEADVVVVGGADGTLHFFDFPSGKKLSAVHAHDDPIQEIAVLPAKAGAYSVDAVGNVHLVTLQPPADALVACTARPPHAAAFTPDRKWVIFAASDPKSQTDGATLVEVVELATGKQVNLFSAPAWFRDPWVSPDGRTLFLRHPGQPDPDKAVVSAWELPSFKRLPDSTGALFPGGGHVRIPKWENQTLVAPDPARDRYATAKAHGPLTVHGTKDRRMIWAFSPDFATSSLAVVPSDGTILACSADGTVWRYTVPE